MELRKVCSLFNLEASFFFFCSSFFLILVQENPFHPIVLETAMSRVLSFLDYLHVDSPLSKCQRYDTKVTFFPSSMIHVFL